MSDGAKTIFHLIDGARVEATSDQLFDRYSPCNGRLLFSLPVGTPADVDRAVASARCAFDDGRWSEARPSTRKAALHRFADLVEAHADELDLLDAQEMGKPISLRFNNAARGAQYVRFCAEMVDKIVGDVFVSDSASYVTLRRVPVGVVGGIASWNFPTMVALLKSVPALAAGNTVVLKPSEFSPSSALVLGELALQAGIPEGVLNVVVGTGESVGRAMGLHPAIDMITFTGSTVVGRLLMQYSGQSNLKKVLAECGGKSPQVVFDDGIQLDQVADGICASILANQGQVCSAGSRVIVQKSLESDLVSKIAVQFGSVKMGDPTDPHVTFGPLTSRQQLERVENHIARATDSGAELVVGGKRMMRETGGNFIEPALFRAVRPTSAIAQEEVFGPVLSVISFGDEGEAVSIANGTVFGLAATVWSARVDTGLRVAKKLRSPVVIKSGFVNSEGANFNPGWEPAAQSGNGIEGGMRGIESYVRRQSISIMHGSS